MYGVFVLQPLKKPALGSPAYLDAKTKPSRARTPWTDEEVQHLQAAVMALGKGRWALALAQYKFQDCRTAGDLKDKWRNLNKS